MLAAIQTAFTAQGKVGSPLKLILIGTLGPMATRAGHWWYDLVHAGTKGRVHVQLFAGDRATWDKWSDHPQGESVGERRLADFRAKLAEERDAARGDSDSEPAVSDVQAEHRHRRTKRPCC